MVQNMKDHAQTYPSLEITGGADEARRRFTVALPSNFSKLGVAY
jgi:hypothetical protein